MILQQIRYKWSRLAESSLSLKMDLHEAVKLAKDQAEKEVYLKYLQESIISNDSTTIKSVLKFLYIPDIYFNIEFIGSATFEVLLELFKSKEQQDRIVQQCQCIKNDCVNFSAILDKNKILLEKNEYKFIQSLMKEVNTIYEYRDISFILNRCICDAIYYALPSLVENLIRVKTILNVEYIFNPHKSEKQLSVLKWILRNLDNIKNDGCIGWTSGPDSGYWPSNNPDDYMETYEIMGKLIDDSVNVFNV